MKREMEIVITPDGKVDVQVRCVPGAACEEFSKAIEDALGGEVINRVHTAEFFQEEETVDDRLTLKQ